MRKINRLVFLRFLLFITFIVCLVLITIFGNQFGSIAYARIYNLGKSGVKNCSNSSVTVTSDGDLLLVVNPDSNTITLIDANTLTLISEVTVGIDPRSVTVSPNGTRAYIANRGSDSISVLDLDDRAVIAEIPIGDQPVGISISPDGNLLAITEAGIDQVRLMDPLDLSTLSVYPVPDRPYGLAFTPDSRQLLITHLLSGDVTWLNIKPFNIYLPWVNKGAFDSFLPERSIYPYNSQSNIALKSSISTWPNVAPAPSIVINSDGTRAYLPQTMANSLGYNTSFDTTVFPKVSVLDLLTKVHQRSEHISLPETDRPVGLPWAAALIRDDRELWVVNAASNDVSVINISDPEQPTRVANIPVGDHPTGIAFSQDSSLAFVNNTLAGTLSVIDTNTFTITNEVVTTNIPVPPVLLHGKRLFSSSARPDLAQASWISCNTCHIEGEQDGRNWLLQFLGEVPPGQQPVIRRNTTSLLGMIETYPLRWSAEWDESADSEFSVRFEQFGSGLIEGEMHPTLGDPNQGRSKDLDSLAAFIDSLMVPPRHHTLTQTEKRGKTIFESHKTACVTCHPEPLYTDLKVHDVGTADGEGEWFGPLIDTPTLRFLYDSAPYLHDGSAATLFDVLVTANSNDEHGVTSHLTPQEIQDLVAFLLALPFTE